MSIRTAIITDEAFNPTDEVERARIEQDLRSEFNDRPGLPLDVVYSGRDFGLIPTLDVDLLVVDFGGLIDSYSSPAGDYMRSTERWAEDHPSGFVLVWSGLIGDAFARKFRPFNDATGWYDEMTLPTNLRPLDQPMGVGIEGSGWSDWRHETWRLLRNWFGLGVER